MFGGKWKKKEHILRIRGIVEISSLHDEERWPDEFDTHIDNKRIVDETSTKLPHILVGIVRSA